MAKHNVSVTVGRELTPSVVVDGHEIAHGLRSININIGSNGVPQVEAEIAVSVLDVISLDSIDADVTISLSPNSHEALVALGWTPPAGDR